MRPERVSVIDETGKLLADEAAPDNSLSGVSSDERKLAYENRLRSEVEAIVSSVVGPGHARIQINADFDVLKLNRKVGEAIDIYLNNRLVARGEVVLVEDKLGVTMTEIIKADHN